MQGNAQTHQTIENIKQNQCTLCISLYYKCNETKAVNKGSQRVAAKKKKLKRKTHNNVKSGLGSLEYQCIFNLHQKRKAQIKGSHN